MFRDPTPLLSDLVRLDKFFSLPLFATFLIHKSKKKCLEPISFEKLHEIKSLVSNTRVNMQDQTDILFGEVKMIL